MISKNDIVLPIIDQEADILRTIDRLLKSWRDGVITNLGILLCCTTMINHCNKT